METAVIELESAHADPENINAIFRAAHTIKGSAGLFGLDLIVSFAQVMESVLDLLRGGGHAVDPALISILLRSGDYIGRLVDAIESGTELLDPDPEVRQELLHELQGVLAAHGLGGLTRSRKPAALMSVEPSGGGHWHVSLRFHADAMQRGIDPLAVASYLGELGDFVYFHTLSESLPELAHMDPVASYFGFELGLRTSADRTQIERTFDLVAQESTIRVLPPHASVAEYLNLIEALPDERQRLGEILIAAGALSERELANALTMQSAGPAAGVRLGELLVQEQLVPEPVVSAALSKQKQSEERKQPEPARVVKVDARKLDELIELVGELVVASEGARLAAGGKDRSRLGEAQGKVSALVEQLRDGALKLRMIPIGEVFQRFPRVVRDISNELGKQVELLISGADAELDKSMVERLADPLMHIVRNAMDHGLEGVEERATAGKDPKGRLHLHAHHESGSIVVEISDDGRGLDDERIRAKAIERKLIAPDARLTPSEVQQLILLPGFSTAAKVTSLSGRGVGMDVVKRNVEELRGELEIQSEKGRGTTFRIRLPLTLAIIDGFQVAVGDATFVLPLEMVVECVNMVDVRSQQRLISLRGQALPYLRLRDVMRLPGGEVQRESLVVVSYAGQRVGLVVDRLIGDMQAVIKPLGPLFRAIKEVSSSTILGDGTVALILDVPTLIARAAASRTCEGRHQVGGVHP
jgi:two-component system chemotaxis sensor kinase CheA